MRIPSDHILAVTYELTRSDFALDAVRHLSLSESLVAVTGLGEVIYEPVSARVAVAAIEALAPVTSSHPLYEMVFAALLHGVLREESTVQIACIQQLELRQDPRSVTALRTLLATCPKWIIRRAVLNALMDIETVDAAIAATDPHWRVRHALIERIEKEKAASPQLLEQMRAAAACPRSDGVASYLAGVEAQPYEAPSQLASLPFWDIDASVLLRELKNATDAAVLQDDNTLSLLMAHTDSRIRKWAAQKIRTHGDHRHLLGLIPLLREPRLPAFGEVRDVILRLDTARYEELLQADTGIKELLHTSSQDDPRPWQSRIAAMTLPEAADIMANPVAEESWRVIRHAAKLTKTPLWEVEPSERWQPAVPSLPLQRPSPVHDVAASLPSNDRLRSLPLLGISGHYGLPAAGFHSACDAGVDLMFWEPNYNSMTGFFRQASPSLRCDIRLMVGTFEAEAAGIRRDVERALRLLHIPQIHFFMMFWVKTWKRINDEVRRTLDDLVEEGKIHTYGLSTHNYELAVDAINTGWGPIMVRHNAAHRGAEKSVFIEAAKQNTTLIAFNNTCYGRLLTNDTVGAEPGVRISAADCYRFSLEQQGVSACLTAPANMAQLKENLTVLQSPELPTKRRKLLLQQGRTVRREDKRFRQQVRYR